MVANFERQKCFRFPGTEFDNIALLSRAFPEKPRNCMFEITTNSAAGRRTQQFRRSYQPSGPPRRTTRTTGGALAYYFLVTTFADHI